MWTHLEFHLANLEQVFEPLRIKAEQYDRAWSIAELRLADDDVKWLQSWFSCWSPQSTEKWDSNYRRMFGSLFICVGAEVCREKSSEGSVWLAMRSILPESHILQRDLFLSNGQPSFLTKSIIADAVRSLNLRHAMDIEGTQQWFVTIKLQFGFTYRGAKNRLAEWLVNLGRPQAVQYLDGESKFSELSSDSFQSLWRALMQYRRGLIEEKEVRATLQLSPWIKAHWIDDLLKESIARIATLGIEEAQTDATAIYEQEVSGEEFCPIADVALEWSKGTTPRIKIHLDRQAIKDEIVSVDIGELDFYIDGRKLHRWIRQGNGSWAGEERIYAEPEQYHRQQPNLSPQTLVVRSGLGETLIEWNLADSGLSEEVLVFDLDREKIVKTGEERLEPNRRYAIVCDRKCKIQGCVPDDTFEKNGIPRKAIRLPMPLSENLCVSFEDFMLWQPIRQNIDSRPRFSLTLTTQVNKILSLQDKSQLFVDGLPEDAGSVKLLIDTKTYGIQRDSGRWRTLKEIGITPELAARQQRVRVRFLSGGQPFTLEPRLAFSLLGAAMLRHKQDNNNIETVSFDVLREGDELIRSEETVYLRIWIPEQEKEATVLEGDCQVGLLRHGKVRLRDLPGHGGSLRVLCGSQVYDLGIHCKDTGCIARFIPAMLNNTEQLFLSHEKDPAEVGEHGYSVWEWVIGEKGKSRLQRLSDKAISGESTKRRWKVRCSTSPMAIALTYKGVWCGAYWNLDDICNYINTRPDFSERDFAIIKWLRVPVLSPTLVSIFRKAVLQAPCRFIKAWMNDIECLDEALTPHSHIDRLDSVIRHFLWNEFPPAHVKDAITMVGQCGGNAFREDRCSDHLTKLSEISPVLLWKGMVQCRNRCPRTAGNLFNIFTYNQVSLLSISGKKQMYYRLQGLENRALSATGLNKERLQEILLERFRSIERQQGHPSDIDSADLLKLGEALSGRKYLSARMAQYWLDQSQV
ncbi:MAG: hypothetical protein WC532_06305 [Candidatus Omnitrophota bacterium]